MSQKNFEHNGEAARPQHRQAPSQKRKAPPKRKKKSGSSGQILAYLIVVLAFSLVITLFIGGLILYSFYDTAENTEIYSLNVVYNEKKLHSLDAETANTEYGLYLPFSYLAEIGSFGIAGDGDDITIFIIGSDNRIEASKNSSLVVINDNPIRISSPILYDDKTQNYLIPIVLIENYINGIQVSYDSETMICTVSADAGKTAVALKLLLPEGMPNAYFPDSYKYYGTSENTSQ